MEVTVIPPPSGEILSIAEFLEKIKDLEFYGVYSSGHQDLPSNIRIVWLVDKDGEYLPETFKVKGSVDEVRTAWRVYMKV